MLQIQSAQRHPVVFRDGSIIGGPVRSGSFLRSISKAAVVRAYSWYAPVYNLLFGRVLQAGRMELAKLLADNYPPRLLEIGVGTGLALPHYPAISHTCGVDISLDMLDRAQALVKRKTLENVDLICADAEQLPFPDTSFDCVTLPYVLSVTPNPQRLLAEVRRVCVPMGRILVLNHFEGAGVWKAAEWLSAPLTDCVGFRSTMPMEVLDSPLWQVVNVRIVNLLGLSKLVDIRNSHE